MKHGTSARRQRPGWRRYRARHAHRLSSYDKIIVSLIAILAWLWYHPASTATGAVIVIALVVLLAGWAGRRFTEGQ